MEFLDAHQHFWDLERNYLPWLSDKPIAFRYGDYSALRRNYLPSDYRRDTAAVTIVGSVFIETEWDPRDPLGELAWVRRLHAATGLPTAMVAQAWLDRPDAAELLDAYADDPLVRGVRHKPTVSRTPSAVSPGQMSEPAWRRGFSLLAGRGLSFDLQVPYWHLKEARQLADDFPDTAIVLDHAGLPSDRSPEGIAAWRDGLRIIAGAPNVSVKISGLGQADQPWRADANRAIVLETIAAFGVERVMFGSNLPVDGLVGGFDEIIAGYSAIVGGLAADERQLLFVDNARRIYRIA